MKLENLNKHKLQFALTVFNELEDSLLVPLSILFIRNHLKSKYYQQTGKIQFDHHQAKRMKNVLFV